jgi:hypothetical protein
VFPWTHYSNWICFAAVDSPPILPPGTTVAENRDFRPLRGEIGKILLKSKNLSQNTGFSVTPKFSGVNSIKYALKAILCLIRVKRDSLDIIRLP